MPVAALSCDNQKHLQVSPWGQKCPQLKTTREKWVRARYNLDSQISRSNNKASHWKIRAVDADYVVKVWYKHILSFPYFPWSLVISDGSSNRKDIQETELWTRVLTGCQPTERRLFVDLRLGKWCHLGTILGRPDQQKCPAQAFVLLHWLYPLRSYLCKCSPVIPWSEVPANVLEQLTVKWH